MVAEAGLAVDDGVAQSALGGVVGRFDTLDLGEGPQCWPELVEATAERFRGRVAVGGAALEEAAQFVLERFDLGCQPAARSLLVTEAVPGGEEPLADEERGLPDLGGGAAALGERSGVADEVRPAEGALLEGQVFVA